MEIGRTFTDLGDFRGEILVSGLFEGEAPSGVTAELDRLSGGTLTRAAGKFRGEFGEIWQLALPGGGPESALIIGLGRRQSFDGRRARRAAGIALRRASAMHAVRVGIASLGADALGLAEAVEASVIGAANGAYRFDRYRRETPHQIEAIEVYAPGDQDVVYGSAARAAAISKGIRTARDLVNLPPNDKVPMQLAAMVEEFAGEAGLACEVLDAEQLRAMGAGGILAVAGGSAHPPALVVLRHDGGRGDWHGFLGKGMTFDSGGLDLKTPDGMLTMKSDMAGAAAVIGAMLGLAGLRVSGRFLGVVVLAENMTGSSAFRPSDVLRMLSGSTVEVGNTDAEGRLVLADGIEWLRRQKVSDIIDLATLTGAIGTALGSHRAGLFANDDRLADAVLGAGSRAGELYWRMPLDDAYMELLKSPVADISSTGGRTAGSITAAQFLHHFAGDLPWVHLDIAFTAFRDREEELAQGGTGFGAETLVRFAERA